MKHGNTWSWLIIKLNTFLFVKTGSPRSRGPQYRVMFWKSKSNRRKEGTPLSNVYCNISQVYYSVIWALRVQLWWTPTRRRPNQLPGSQRAMHDCFCVLVVWGISFPWSWYQLLLLVTVIEYRFARSIHNYQLKVCLICHFIPTEKTENMNPGHIGPIWSCFCFLGIWVLLLSPHSSLLSRGLRKPILKRKEVLPVIQHTGLLLDAFHINWCFWSSWK